LIAFFVFRKFETMNPTNLLGLTQHKLADFADQIGEPRYRGKQIFTWLYTKGARNFSAMSDLQKELRDQLSQAACIEGITLVSSQPSRDGTTKFLFELHDGLKIESVLIPPATAFKSLEAAREEEQQRLTLCISSQAGCPLDCKFCATGTMGFLRNLSTGEIIDQVLQIKRITDRKITNIVFMGMGEPMMNYDNVMSSVEIISSGMGIAAKRITLSTAGWAEKIRQMGDEKRKVKLAVSLHSAIDETRAKLMPINKKFDLDSLLASIEHYYSCTKQRVTYEYIFFEGVNDSDREVAQLVKFARRVPSKINVIPYHSISFTQPVGLGAELRPSSRMNQIVERLRTHNLTVMVRSNAGEDIAAACGQLAVRSERHLRRQPKKVSVA
jgi:23S rRNA (adenine2503-C2)-methyltransferase